MSQPHARVARLLAHLQPAVTDSSAGLQSHVTSGASRVGVITLNRPSALNALSDALMAEVGSAVREFEAGGNIGAIVLTGAGKAFAAGADIKEMAGRSFCSMLTRDKIAPWEVLSQCKIPLIAAVNGVALGGGCEIAMMCDIILASDTAKFGQPEIKIGTIPGAGGTQRLTRAIGKSKAMEMCLTGNMMSAAELERAGLVSRVLPADQLLPAALQLAEQIAGMSLPVVKLAKAAVQHSFESSLSSGVSIERSLFHSTFALEDQKEGMNAFVNKRKPEWQHQ